MRRRPPYHQQRFAPGVEVKLSIISLSFVVAAVACGGTASNSTPPPDTDAGSLDAGNPDAGNSDAGSSDAGNQDAGEPDAGSPDAGNPDGGGPLASFTAAATAVALDEVVFDGSASTGAASFSWDFGDGEHGGMGKISHAFAQAGSFTVKLTVADASGKTSSAQHAVTVSAAAHAASVPVSGLVHDVNGPLAGVLVQDINGSSASTAADGTVALSLTAGIAHTLKLSKTGYSDQYQPINLDSAATSGYFQTVLTAQEAPQNLNATTGGSLTGKDGAKITLPAGAVQGASGTIQISMTPVDISGAMLATFPGKFSGID
ncbi:MAG TPA: PKD domain-containing protein, partial [Myxococcales bacterium]|nr:PKD domain-containing protein [Myxococcales bacterium]